MKKESNVLKKQGFIKRLTSSNQITRVIVYLSAAIPAFILIFIAVLASVGIIKPIYIPSGEGYIIFGASIDFIIIAILILTGIFGIYEFLNLRRIRKIDERFPDFVRDLAESRRAGMTFTKAIMYSSRGNYGYLTVEIQKIARQISWGSSIDNALNSFAKRVNTKLIKRTIFLIIEANKSGGNVADVLDAASKDARELKLIQSERRAAMMSFVAVLYVGIGVFLLIIIVLCKSILPSMLGEGAQQAASAYGAAGVGGAGGITQQGVLELFFYASLVQSFGMGIVTGVFEGGDFKSGIKHIFIMMLITWLIFKVFITGI